MHFPIEAQRPLTSMGLLWTVFFSASKLDGHWINAAIMSRPRTLSVSGGEWGVGWPGLRASAWWLEGLSKDCISFWLTAILYYKESLKLFALSPIADFSSSVEIKTAATYFLIFAWRNCLIFIIHFTQLYTTFLVSVLQSLIFFFRSFIHSYNVSRLG